jgi:hypothetical protein
MLADTLAHLDTLTHPADAVPAMFAPAVADLAAVADLDVDLTPAGLIGTRDDYTARA